MNGKKIKLNKIYKAKDGFGSFPQFIILLRKYNDLESGRYAYFDIERGKEKYYLTEHEMNIGYELIDDQYI